MSRLYVVRVIISVLLLQGHHGEVWSLAVSSSGNFVVSGSHDKSLRLWEKTEEPLVLEEQKELVGYSPEQYLYSDSIVSFICLVLNWLG